MREVYRDTDKLIEEDDAGMWESVDGVAWTLVTDTTVEQSVEEPVVEKKFTGFAAEDSGVE